MEPSIFILLAAVAGVALLARAMNRRRSAGAFPAADLAEVWQAFAADSGGGYGAGGIPIRHAVDFSCDGWRLRLDTPTGSDLHPSDRVDLSLTTRMTLTALARTDFVATLADAGRPPRLPGLAPVATLKTFALATPALNARYRCGASDSALAQALFTDPDVVDALGRFARGSAGFGRLPDGGAVVVAFVVVAFVDAPVADRGQLDAMRDLVVALAGALLERGLIFRS